MSDDMRLPPYVYRQKSRGRWRLRFEKRGLPKRWMQHRPGTRDFREEYEACLNGEDREPKHAAPPGSISALVRAYERSATFAGLSEATRRQRSRFYEIVSGQAPNADAAALTPQKVRELRDNRAETPGAANNLVKALSALYAWGREAGLVEVNPAEGVARLKPKRKGGHPAWTPEDVSRFRAAHPVGSKAHLALCLFLFSGARIGDARVIGPQHVREGLLEWQPQKAGSAPVTVPILPPLAEAINAFRPPVHGLRGPFLVTAYGQPHASEKALANWFKRVCTEAGVEKTAHGIRKALGGLLADLGCSEHEIMAVLGHTNPRTSAIYTASAQRRKLAASAAEKLARWKW